MGRLYLLAFTILVAPGTIAGAEPATDLLGDPLPEGAVQRLGTLRLRYGSVGDLGYLPDGRVIVATGRNIDILDMSVGERQVSHRVSSGNLTGINIRFDGEAMIACDSAGNVYEWSVADARVMRKWATGQRGLVSAYYSPDQTRVLSTGGSPPTLKEFDLATGEELIFIEGKMHSFSQGIYDAEGTTGFVGGTAGSDEILAHYSLATGELLHEWHKDYINYGRSPQLSPDGKRVLAGTRSMAIEFAIDGYEELNRFTGHHGHGVPAIAYCQDPDQILTGSRDGSIRRWNRLTGEVLARWFAHGSNLQGISHLLLSPDGQWVLSYAKAGNMLVERSVSDGTPRLAWDRHALGVQASAVMPDGRTVSGSEDGTVRVWDTLSGKQTLLIEQAAEGVWAVAASPEGQRIAAGCKDGVIREFAVSDGRLLRELSGHVGYVRSVQYMPGAPTSDSMPALVSCADDGTIRIWGRSGNEPLRVLEGDRDSTNGHRGGVLALGISEDGMLLLSGGRDGTMRLWDLQQGTQKAVFRGHRGWVEAVAFAGGVRQGLSATRREGIVRRWDLTTGDLLAEIDHGSGVMSLACTGDGNMVFAGGVNATISVWDATGEQVAVLRGHSASVNSLAISTDKAHLVSASEDSTLLVWKTPQR